MIIFVVGKVVVVDQNNSCGLLGCDVVFSDLCECEPNRNDDDNKESIRWLTGHHHLLLLIPPRLSHSSPLQLIHQSVITKISMLTFTSEQNQAGSITRLCSCDTSPPSPHSKQSYTYMPPLTRCNTTVFFTRSQIQIAHTYLEQ